MGRRERIKKEDRKESGGEKEERLNLHPISLSATSFSGLRPAAVRFFHPETVHRLWDPLLPVAKTVSIIWSLFNDNEFIMWKQYVVDLSDLSWRIIYI